MVTAVTLSLDPDPALHIYYRTTTENCNCTIAVTHRIGHEIVTLSLHTAAGQSRSDAMMQWYYIILHV